MENTINEKRSTDLNSVESVCTYAASGQYVERMFFILGVKVEKRLQFEFRLIMRP